MTLKKLYRKYKTFMEIKRITQKKIWNSTLEKFDNSTMFLDWEWGDFERAQGFEFENWGVFEGKRCLGLLPVKVINAKRGKYLHIRHGPLINWDDYEMVGLVVGFLKKYAKEKKVWLVRISPLLSKNKENANKLKALGFSRSTTHSSDAELTLVLDLTQGEQQIFSQFRKTTRNLIRKAEKLGVEVKNASDLCLFEDFKTLYLDTVKRQKWSAYTTKYIKDEYKRFSSSKKAEMFAAYYKGEPVSAAIFLKHRKQVIYHFSGSSTRNRKVPSTYLLHWEAIKHFKNKGFNVYNFWGVCPGEQKKHPWYGLSLFKRGFSKQEVEFVHAHDLLVNPLGYLTRAFEFIEKKVRGY